MSDIFKNIRDGKPSLGIIMKGGPQIVDYIAQAKYDFVVPDMMFSRLDWDEIAYITRACHAKGMACYPRIQAFPFASDRTDGRLVVDAARCLTLQADGVCMSVRNAEEVREVVSITADWHRGVAPQSAKHVESLEEQNQARTLIFASIESKGSIEHVDEIIDVEGLTGLFIAWHDFTREIGYPLEVEHPEVLKAADRIVKRARKKGLVVMANMGFFFPDNERNIQRIANMAEMGIQLIIVQLVEFVVYTTLNVIREKIEAKGVKVLGA
jgi:2-keto-3-deoxy-L-rhamnonate aldolase RhmA